MLYLTCTSEGFPPKKLTVSRAVVISILLYCCETLYRKKKKKEKTLKITEVQGNPHHQMQEPTHRQRSLQSLRNAQH